MPAIIANEAQFAEEAQSKYGEALKPLKGEQPQSASLPTPNINGIDSGQLPSESTPAHTKTSWAGIQANVGINDRVYSGKNFPRISMPVELMRNEYDVVVIGSGYGGGVAASRMARGGQSVCLLELGKERWPGEYPTTLQDAAPQVHVSGHLGTAAAGGWFSKGDPTGLYHLVVGEGQNAFIANGLGGTSLLNANVFMRADKQTMAARRWPAEIRKAGLDKCMAFTSLNRKSLSKKPDYDRAETVLEPTEYPNDYPLLRKLAVLEEQAQNLNLADKFYRVKQTTRFVDGPNSTGVEMQASTLSGMDSTGVNDGSKSSTLVNYLSDAWNWGTEIFTQCEVRHIKACQDGEGYIVHFAWHGCKRAAFRQAFYNDLMWVRAKKFVFLGAGSLGTTEILLRSKQSGLQMSDRVGTGISGNGDILAFGYNTDREINGIGRACPVPELPIGPTINGVIDCREQANFLDGFVLEEGAIPESLSGILQVMLESLPDKHYPKPFGISARIRHLLSRSKSRIFGPYVQGGSVERTQTYLIMSHDDNQAILTLRAGKPYLQFLGVGRTEHVKELNGRLRDATNSVGGTFINSPFYAAFGQKEITVHAIGGAVMSNDGTGSSGVTNHKGQLLKGMDQQCHPGIICVDGSVVPLALGANPFATITALAERSVEEVAKEKNIKIDFHTRNGILNLFGQPRRPLPVPSADSNLLYAREIFKVSEADGTNGIDFSEIMEGNIYIGDDIDDFQIAAQMAKGSGQTSHFFLSVHAWDVNALVARKDHPALLTGTMTCGVLSRDPFMVRRGTFQLFNQDPRRPDTTNLTYDFDMVSTEGRIIHVNGYKVVNSSVAFSLWATWKATSTLYVTLTTEDGHRVGRGILHIRPTSFLSEALTFTPVSQTLLEGLGSSRQFVSYFAKQVAKSFLGPLNALQWPSAAYTGYFADKTPPAETYQIVASDKVQTIMRMWSAGKAPKGKMFFIPGAAVDHQIFALPTIERNAVEYFTAMGYEVWIIVHRTGKTAVAKKGYTAFDARLDVRAGLEKIREIQNSSDKIYVVAHCAGSIALASGLLDGTVPTNWISGIVASNVFAHPKFATVNTAKASLPISLAKIYNAVVGSWFSCTSSRYDNFIQQLMNQVLRFYPVGGLSEVCNSVVCHRSELVFGRLWSHRNLNQATHENLSRFLGGTSMPALDYLMKVGTAATVFDHTGADLVTKENLARLKGVPILLFSGSENAVYSTQATDISYNALRNAFGEDNYERVVFQDKGHLDCWMGVEAVKDVYPTVLAHMLKVSRGEENE